MVEDPLGIQKQLAEDDQVFNAMAGVSGVGRFDSRREKVQDLTGFSHVNVMRVAAKASDIQIRGIPEPTEEEQERMKEQAEIKAAQASISPAKSTVSNASDLGEERLWIGVAEKAPKWVGDEQCVHLCMAQGGGGEIDDEIPF